MSDPIDGWTRRGFLGFIGALGGSMAVHEVMTAMGWLSAGPAYAGPPQLAAGSGAGRSVAILGAGIGGLTTAYELTKAGYNVIVLEPQRRAGGRSLTARRGTVITEESREHGTTTQTCNFDEGLYLNCGPGRLPYHHRRVLHYCRELGVPLEIYVMTTTANLWQRETAFAGQPVVRRRLEADAMGYISELLAKQVCKGSLDQQLTAAERKNLLELLVSFGDLNGSGSKCTVHTEECRDPKSYRYCGSTRAGCHDDRSVYSTCKASDPVPLSTLLASRFWNGTEGSFYQPLVFEWQPTLFQPVGGMDQIVQGFVRQVGTLVRYGMRVDGVHLESDSVRVEAMDLATGKACSFTTDYCISNMPLPLLAKVRANFAPDFDRAVKRAKFDPTCKVGWQANARFWENDRNQIYGGISYLDAPITQIWYPSEGYFDRKGTLTGAYNYETAAVDFGRLAPPQRLRDARTQGMRLHREIGDDAIVPLDRGLSIAWQNVPYQNGGWANWNADSPDDAKAYARLLAPDRRFHVVGDQVSPVPGWQEGAMMSAEHVVEQIAGLRPTTVPEIEQAPHTRRLILGRH